MLTAILASCAVSSCARSPEIGIKATVIVEVDGKAVERSAVWRTFISRLSLGGFLVDMTGDAIVMDLGRRGIVYVLPRGGPLRQIQNYGSIATLLDFIQHSRDGRDRALSHLFEDRVAYRSHSIKKLLGEPIPICQLPASFERPTYCLNFVRFADASRPETVRMLDPHDLAEDLGRGVGLRSVTLEYTNEPRSHSDLRSLPWLSTADPRRTLMTDPRSRGPASTITYADFRRDK